MVSMLIINLGESPQISINLPIFNGGLAEILGDLHYE